MKKSITILFLLMGLSSPLYAGQSTIMDVEGKACMGDDKSRKQTEQAAMADARRTASERAVTYLKSETQVKDFAVAKDLLNAYSHAAVKVIEELEKGWYRDAASGECYKVKIKAEVIPDEKSMQKITETKSGQEDPSAPLNVQLWTDKKEYRQGEKIKIYLKGNKPFYAKVLYKDTGGNVLQLLPNAFRTDNYFNGGVIYELPSGNDRFTLEVSPPFGPEDIILYTSTAPLGDLRLEKQGEVYQVKTETKDIAINTRGVKLLQAGDSKANATVEFFEEKTVVNTGR